MRLKYYLRGLGLGIIFAVIIMMIGFHDNKQSMSDTEIIEKAKTLGMVEAKNISGTVADEYNSEKTDSSAANSDASSQKAETEQDSQMQDSQTAQEDTQQEATQPAADAKQETVEPQDAVTTHGSVRSSFVISSCLVALVMEIPFGVGIPFARKNCFDVSLFMAMAELK